MLERPSGGLIPFSKSTLGMLSPRDGLNISLQSHCFVCTSSSSSSAIRHESISDSDYIGGGGGGAFVLRSCQFEKLKSLCFVMTEILVAILN
jgi:hypothetical protein